MERVKKAADQKVAGQELTVAPEQPAAQIIDLFEALKQSLSDVKTKAAVGAGGAAEVPEPAAERPRRAAGGKGPKRA